MDLAPVLCPLTPSAPALAAGGKISTLQLQGQHQVGNLTAFARPSFYLSEATETDSVAWPSFQII